MPRKPKSVRLEGTHMRVWKPTLVKLRVLAALRQKTQGDLVDELVSRELRQLGYENIAADAGREALAP